MREPILTARLLLRDITEADAELLFELDSDPEVLRYIGPYAAYDLPAYRERTRTVHMPLQAHPWHGVQLVFERPTNAFLGWVFIRPARTCRFATQLGWTNVDDVEVGYRYRRAAWGRGVATEAALPLVDSAVADPSTSGIVACAALSNLASLRVLQNLGLQPVGEVRLPETEELTVKLARVTR